MEAHLNVELDLLEPRTYAQDIEVDLEDCRAVRYGSADVPRLLNRFVHDVQERGVSIDVAVGPGTWHYRPLSRIPRHIRMGALWTEDQRFYQHSGFQPSLIRRAVIMNLEGGRYIYGGSTITQQLVKNLFLSREKTLSRKLEEAILVWLVESNIPKNRILELYLNCIEYGPRIYGIENAARAYFGKHVEELNALEGAFLMGLKPYPASGWRQYERGYVKPWWHRRLRKILEGMARRGWITQEELVASSSWDPVFVTSVHTQRQPRPRTLSPSDENNDDGAFPPTPNDPIRVD
jgi:membrane peptidoglycan carboxypeptidase